MTPVVKVVNGVAKIFDATTGAFKRSVGSNVVEAVVQGASVVVRDKKGISKIFDAITGAFKRTI